ncbi:unnamed protein product, partial [Rhizoctonia solani]
AHRMPMSQPSAELHKFRVTGGRTF